MGSWRSTGNRTLTAAVGFQPILKKSATPTGSSAVRFSQDQLKISSGSPVAGLTSFSIALVFRADAPGGNYSSQWYGKSGLVDAEQGGVMADWGAVLDQNGSVGFGIGNPDTSVYLQSAPSLVDGKYHVGVFTWGGGEQGVYVDNRWFNTASASLAPRNDAGFSIGGTHTGINGSGQRFTGDLVEIRFYNTKLSSNEISSVVQGLADIHINSDQPVIRSFAASPAQVLIGGPVVLSWQTTNATGLWIEPGLGRQSNPVGTVTVFPRSNTVFTLTSSNQFGLRTAEASVLVDQGIPMGSNQVVVTTLNTPRSMTLTGWDPQGSNLTCRVIALPAHGSILGTPPALTYQPVPNFIGNDQLTFVVNDGRNSIRPPPQSPSRSWLHPRRPPRSCSRPPTSARALGRAPLWRRCAPSTSIRRTPTTFSSCRALATPPSSGSPATSFPPALDSAAGSARASSFGSAPRTAPGCGWSRMWCWR